MFVTAEEVMEVTPYSEITNEMVRQAQFIIETYIAREEVEVTDPQDIRKVRRAVIYQTVYMKDNPDITFNQISVSSVSRGDGLTVFRAGDWAAPFIAPMALMSLTGLSWRRSRTVKIGRTGVDADDYRGRSSWRFE